MDKALLKCCYRGDKLIPELKPYVPDYPVNVFEIAWLSEDTVKNFRSDFKYVADYYVQMRTTGTYKGSPESMKHVREVLQLMTRLTGDVRFANIAADKEWVESEGGIKSMESAIDFYWNDGVKQGIEQGKERTLVALICKKLGKGKDVYQIADEVEEDVSRVKAICIVAERFAPDYEAEKVLEALHADVMA